MWYGLLQYWYEYICFELTWQGWRSLDYNPLWVSLPAWKSIETPLHLVYTKYLFSWLASQILSLVTLQQLFVCVPFWNPGYKYVAQWYWLKPVWKYRQSRGSCSCSSLLPSFGCQSTVAPCNLQVCCFMQPVNPEMWRRCPILIQG